MEYFQSTGNQPFVLAARPADTGTTNQLRPPMRVHEVKLAAGLQRAPRCPVLASNRQLFDVQVTGFAQNVVGADE